MQKWEYLVIEASRNYLMEINGEGAKSPDLTGCLNKLGEEGWELGGIMASPEGLHYWRLVFKRLK